MLPDLQKPKIRESLEKNKLETKEEYEIFIKVLNRDRANLVNTNLAEWMVPM